MAVSLEITCERCGKKEKPVTSKCEGEERHFFKDGLKIIDQRPGVGDIPPSDLCSGCRKLYDFFLASGTPEGRKKIGVPQHFEVLMNLLQRVDRAAGGAGGEIAGDLRTALVGLLKSGGGTDSGKESGG